MRKWHIFMLLLLLWFWNERNQAQLRAAQDPLFLQTDEVVYRVEEPRLAQQFSDVVRELAQGVIRAVVGIGDWVSS